MIRKPVVSNNLSDAPSSIDVSPCRVCSIEDGRVMTIPASIRKTLASSWAPGDNSGCLDAGTKTASTWYHVFVIGGHPTLADDVLASTSPLNPFMPAGFTSKSRICSVLVEGNGCIRPFFQTERYFYWAKPTIDANSIPLSAQSAFFLPLSTPLGIKVKATIAPFPRLTANYFAIRDPDTAGYINTDWSVSFSPDGMTGTDTGGSVMEIWTNNVSQVQCYSGANGTLLLFTRGWFDPMDEYL